MAFVTAQGLEIKTLETINNELGAQQKQDINSTLNVASDSPVGQLNGTFASQCRELWEVLEVAYNGFNPDAAEGFLLEALSALTGTNRQAAKKSVVSLTIDIDGGTNLTSGTHFANVVGEPTNRWTPVNDLAVGFDGVYVVDFEAEFAGVVVANAATITDINTAVSGWNSVTNVADAVVGTEVDTDPQLRTRREDELRSTGSATVDAIRADILLNDSVLQCNVFENTGDVLDANGLPPRSIEVVVFDGASPALTNDEVAQLIWDSKPGGIKTHGGQSGTATSTQASLHVMNFSRPTTQEVWLELDVDIDVSVGWEGVAAAKEALVALNSSKLLVGRDVIVNLLESTIMGFAGVIDVTATRLGLAASPVTTVNLVISPRELARLDTARIIINENLIAIP